MTSERLLTLSPYRCFPPQSGGGRRIYHLNRGLARAGFEVELIAGSYLRRAERPWARPYRETISPGLVEQRYANPVLMALNIVLRRAELPEVGVSLLPDLAVPAPRLTRALADHRLVMLEHPYWFDRIADRLRSRHVLVLDAHNIESLLFPRLSDGSALDRQLLRRLEALEGRAMRAASAIFFCSESDRQQACEMFGLLPERTHLAPNGVDTNEVAFVTPEQRLQAKHALGFKGGAVGLFVGTNWPPNVEAVRALVEIARALPEVTFAVVGSVGRSFAPIGLPNFVMPGVVETLEPWLAAADVAVNPMISGSGSNLKLFEYLAAGLPVVSTKFGARGLDVANSKAIVAAPIENFPEAVRALLAAPDLPARRETARRLALRYDWDAIAGRMAETLRSISAQGGSGSSV